MGEILNLRRAHKRKTRAGLDAEAAAKRAEFGRSRAAREAAIKQRNLEAARLDGHQRTVANPAPDDDKG
jgi:hypothetical protein